MPDWVPGWVTGLVVDCAAVLPSFIMLCQDRYMLKIIFICGMSVVVTP